jgi:hypothetical protein
LVQAVKALRALPDGARRVLEPQLYHYLRERIIVSSWYPEEDYLALITALAKLIPAPEGVDVWDLFGVQAAQHDLTTVYRGMVRSSDTLVVTLKAVKDLFRLYHDTGRVVLTGDDERAQMDVFDYASISSGHCRFITSYAREYLKMALGREIKVKESLCTAGGADRCRREFAR